MYQNLPNLVLGFHGCCKKVFHNVIINGDSLKASDNSYDWLGNGIYFWEQNYTRAMEWAIKRNGEENAAVIGAVIDLGHCLNLTDSAASDTLRTGYELLCVRCEQAGAPLPKNRKSKDSDDILLRDLDCAVIQQIHDYNRQNNVRMFDSVRGIFTEGPPPYEGSAFHERTHIQLCICNPNCIKGYFAPLFPREDFLIP
jgi:hypothetical protein